MRKSIVAIGIVCLASCAHAPVTEPLPNSSHIVQEEPVRIHLGAMAIEYRRAILAAIGYWNCVVGKQVFIVSSDGIYERLNELLVTESWELSQANWQAAKTGGVIRLAVHRRLSKRIELSDRLLTKDREEIETVMRHELGHALRVRHSGDINDLMHPYPLLWRPGKTHPLDASNALIASLRSRFRSTPAIRTVGRCK